jgi:hypothetical protein
MMTTPLRIDEVWIAVAKDEDGNEGMCAMQGPNGSWMPLIAADPDRFEWVERMAGEIARGTGKPVSIIKLTHREENSIVLPLGDDEAISITIKRPS